jgi:hypothetical protein
MKKKHLILYIKFVRISLLFLHSSSSSSSYSIIEMKTYKKYTHCCLFSLISFSLKKNELRTEKENSKKKLYRVGMRCCFSIFFLLLKTPAFVWAFDYDYYFNNIYFQFIFSFLSLRLAFFSFLFSNRSISHARTYPIYCVYVVRMLFLI